MFEKRDRGYETQTSAAFHYLDFAVCVKLVCVAVAAVPALPSVPVESKVSTGQHARRGINTAARVGAGTREEREREFVELGLRGCL